MFHPKHVERLAGNNKILYKSVILLERFWNSSSTVSHSLLSVPRRSQFTLFRSYKRGGLTPVTVSMQNTNANHIYRHYIGLTKFKALKHAPNGSISILIVSTHRHCFSQSGSSQVSQKCAKLTPRASPQLCTVSAP
jgi:hypothetical protein